MNVPNQFHLGQIKKYSGSDHSLKKIRAGRQSFFFFFFLECIDLLWSVQNKKKLQ